MYNALITLTHMLFISFGVVCISLNKPHEIKGCRRYLLGLISSPVLLAGVLYSGDRGF